MTRQEITQFYGEHHRRLYNIAWRILQDSDDAEEVMQDTILKFVSEERDIASDAQVSAWLARTCIRAAIDRLRKRHRRDDFLQEYAREVGPDSPVKPANDGYVEPANDENYVIPGEDPESPSTIIRIRTAMDGLPDPYRLILNLVLIEGLDYEEIAGLTGKKETTLRSLYSRGRAKLAELLK